LAALNRLRTALAPIGRPVRAKLGFVGRARRRSRYLREGIAGICAELRASPSGQAAILREFGARVGDGVSIHAPLHIVNADGDFRRLSIGDRAHIGADVLIDLASDVTIGEEATISMRCTIISHIDVGPGPLKGARPREEGPVSIGPGAYLGAGATILHGVTIGAGARVGAHALVDRDVAAGATVAAPRARLAGGQASE
jgi:acetyltransferase-like isoleucine patch superfamily enzyme